MKVIDTHSMHQQGKKTMMIFVFVTIATILITIIVTQDALAAINLGNT